MSLPKKYKLTSIGLWDYLNESEIKAIQGGCSKNEWLSNNIYFRIIDMATRSCRIGVQFGESIYMDWELSCLEWLFLWVLQD